MYCKFGEFESVSEDFSHGQHPAEHGSLPTARESTQNRSMSESGGETDISTGDAESSSENGMGFA